MSNSHWLTRLRPGGAAAPDEMEDLLCFSMLDFFSSEFLLKNLFLVQQLKDERSRATKRLL